ncbi:uncharacterized protein LOC134538327 [Bacillus rossius redtenbacheri]|uniref:uncharacterized protein LOC134538327 n=1 Tax=Bacillus rossius redtenbacheri TaxID=93214 RepID=UPI002FDEF602
MDITDVTDREICRLCAGMHNKNNMTGLFAENNVGQCLLERIHNYTPLQITVGDCLPKYVCIICKSHIDHWHNFLQLCLKAQENFSSPARNKKGASDGIQARESTLASGESADIATQPAVDTAVAAAGGRKASSTSDAGSGAAESPETRLSPDSTVCESVRPAPASPAGRASARRNYCIARWCNNSTKANPSLSLFRVPKNRNRAAKWLENAERQDLLPLDPDVLYGKFLCGEHFQDSMFTNSTRGRLVWNAIPTVFPKPLFAHKIRQRQADAAVQKMAMEMLHSSVPTRIAPKPETKSSVSVAAPESTETRGTRQKPAGAVQAGGGGCESLASGEGGTTAPADAQAQSSFLAETMCSFQECHEPVFPCRYCGEMFLVKSSLILHQTTYHPEHPVGCEQCGKVNYRSRSEFMGHLCDHADSAMEH